MVLLKNRTRLPPVPRLQPKRTVRRSATLYIEEYSDGKYAVTTEPGEGWDRQTHSDAEVTRWSQLITASWSIEQSADGETPEQSEALIRRYLAHVKFVILWTRLWPSVLGAGMMIVAIGLYYCCRG